MVDRCCGGCCHWVRETADGGWCALSLSYQGVPWHVSRAWAVASGGSAARLETRRDYGCNQWGPIRETVSTSK